MLLRFGERLFRAIVLPNWNELRRFIQCHNLQNGAITYYRTKTKVRRADGAKMQVDIPPFILPLIEKYGILQAREFSISTNTMPTKKDSTRRSIAV